MAPTRRTADRVCEALALGLLLVQGAGIGRSFLVEDRFFSWSPHDQRTDFRITAWRRGEPVKPEELWARYEYGPEGRDWHGCGDPLLVIRLAEARRPPEERWRVRFDYRVNLGPWRTAWIPGEEP